MPSHDKKDELDELTDMVKSLNEKQELWDNLAAVYKNAFDALVRAGFAPDQAITILSQQGLSIKLS